MEERLWSLRAATSVNAQDADNIVERVGELFSEIFTRNSIAHENIVNIQFTQTDDILCINAARAARLSTVGEVLSKVPLFCSLEPPLHGSPRALIRVLITYYHSSVHKPSAIYLHQARKLRSDLFPQHE